MGHPVQWSLRITDTLGTWLLSVVENCPLLGDFELLLYSWQVNSVPRGLSVVEGLSASRSVRFGRLHCICM